MPPKISMAKAAVTQPRRSSFCAPNRVKAARAVIAEVPFIRAMPSLKESRRGRSPARVERLRGRDQLALVEDVPLADDGERHVREVHEVAGGADAAALGDVGRDAGVDHVPHQLQQLDPHAAVALDERVEPHRQHGDGDVGLHRLAETGRVAADQVDLQRLDLVVVDDLVAHRAERGVDAVDDPLGRDLLFQESPAGPAAFERSGRERHAAIADADRDDLLDGEGLSVEHDCRVV